VKSVNWLFSVDEQVILALSTHHSKGGVIPNCGMTPPLHHFDPPTSIRLTPLFAQRIESICIIIGIEYLEVTIVVLDG
jgi:hypothetical protein